MKRKIYTLMFLYFVFTATNVFCDKNQSQLLQKQLIMGETSVVVHHKLYRQLQTMPRQKVLMLLRLLLFLN